MRSSLPVLLVLFALADTASAEKLVTLFEHTGSNDPKGAEGWTALGEVAGQFGPILDTGGIPAWFTDDDSAVAPSGAAYAQPVSPGQIARAASNGWKLSARLRVVDVPDAVSPTLSSVLFLYRDGSETWQLHLGSEADGDPIVTALTGETFTLDGGGSGYHLYALVFDPDLGTADVFVDDVEVLSDLGPDPLAAVPLVGWGSGSGVDTGRGNYNLVRFEVVAGPVPSLRAWAGLALAALLAGSVMRMGRRRA